MYNKFLLTEPNELLNIDLANNLKNLIAPLTPSNMTYLYFLYITTEIRHQQERVNVQKYYANALQLEISSKTSKF